jgi:hypothetical protein
MTASGDTLRCLRTEATILNTSGRHSFLVPIPQNRNQLRRRPIRHRPPEIIEVHRHLPIKQVLPAPKLSADME